MQMMFRGVECTIQITLGIVAALLILLLMYMSVLWMAGATLVVK